MSPYLISFIVSEFKCRENDKKTFGVCSRPSVFNQTEYSFNYGQEIMAKYDEIFDSKYNKHMKKMHLVAEPDLFFLAMENWGKLFQEMIDSLLEKKTLKKISHTRN